MAYYQGQMGDSQGQNAPLRGAFSPVDTQQFAYNSYPAPGQQQQQQHQQHQQHQHQQHQHQQQQHQQHQQNFQPGQQPPSGGIPYADMFGQGFQTNQAAQFGMQFAGNAMNAMHENVQQNVGKYVSLTQLKHYFDVTNMYVLSKLRRIVFPWINKNWHRHVDRDPTGQVVGFKTPRDDTNSPDLYIPVMGLVTYVIAIGLITGRAGVFRPENLGYTASSALGVILFEVVLVKIFCYLLNVGSNELQLLDVVAFSGYKFVTTTVLVLIKPWASRWVTCSAYFYLVFALAFFLIRSMRYAMIPESSSVTGVNVHRKRRIYFLFIIAMLQFPYVWLLMLYKTS